MRRREFIALLGSAAAAPLAAHAQQTAMPVIGFLYASAPANTDHLIAAFRQGLRETGFIEGRNVVIEYRWARDDPKRYPELAEELVRLQVAVIVSPVGTAMAQAIKAATSTIPIVFSMGTDAVRAGLVASYNRPGGNVTGVTAMVSELGAKRLELLRELRPEIKRIGLLINPNNPVATETTVNDVRQAAAAMGLGVEILTARDPREMDKAFADMAQKRLDAAMVSPDPMYSNRRTQLATLAARHVMPTVFPLRDYVVAGGLMSYGPSDVDRYRLVGVYTGRILKGEKPADMPVQQPNRFELIINLLTARALGLIVPATLIARADEVIE
jgi:putative tryptophan/tyrosine transport system substrate-binding protein